MNAEDCSRLVKQNTMPAHFRNTSMLNNLLWNCFVHHFLAVDPLTLTRESGEPWRLLHYHLDQITSTDNTDYLPIISAVRALAITTGHRAKDRDYSLMLSQNELDRLLDWSTLRQTRKANLERFRSATVHWQQSKNMSRHAQREAGTCQNSSKQIRKQWTWNCGKLGESIVSYSQILTRHEILMRTDYTKQ